MLARLFVAMGFIRVFADFTIIDWAFIQRLVKRQDHLSITIKATHLS
jgi:hypothetical protein